MKGIVFIKLMDMVEETYGGDMMDDILDQCDLPSKGAYTSVGTYDHNEFLSIVGELSRRTGLPIRTLVHGFGTYLFSKFHEMMPQFFEEPTCAFEFLQSVHSCVHVEVKKLYPEATLPHFETTRKSDTTLVMTYRSRCPFADFAEGLIAGCIDFYGEDISIESLDQNTDGEFCRIFLLEKQ